METFDYQGMFLKVIVGLRVTTVIALQSLHEIGLEI